MKADKKKKVVEVEESTSYENCIGVVVDDGSPNTLHEFFGESREDDESKNPNDWKKHWKGMPEFVQEDNPAYHKILISFRNKEDYDTFAKLLDQNVTLKTKSIWYPHLGREANSLLRWIED